MHIVTLKIELLGTDIWRRVEFPIDTRMDRVHQIIQLTMGWENAHLHEFILEGRRRIGKLIHDEDFWEEEAPENEDELYFKDLGLLRDDTFKYLYDFGDSWLHNLTVEKIRQVPESKETIDHRLIPVCIAGAMACPPEDCGSVPGYENLCNIMDDPTQETFNDMVNWLGGVYDREDFDLEEVNEELEIFGAWSIVFPEKEGSIWSGR